MTPAAELAGLNAGSLDAYLRALGTMRLAERVTGGLRWSWTERETLVVHGFAGSDALVERIVDGVLADPELLAPVRTPWRGSGAKELVFRELRGDADERLLDWFDACAVARLGRDDTGSRHNPLLGQGGGFGRAEMADAFDAAAARIASSGKRPDRLRRALDATLTGSALDAADAKAVQVTKKAIGAYQSGRGTGPGASAADSSPTTQKATTSAWDLVLVLEGLRCFRGTSTRRSGREQASFPLLVRAEAVGLDAANTHQDREDDNFELLAPLWSAPARASTIVAMIGRARLRLGRRGSSRVAADALEALIGQAGVAIGALGFDRCVRFALYAPSDPRYRYAVRRGVIQASGSVAASLPADTLLPFLRSQARVEPRGEHRTAAHRRAERDLREAVAALAGRDPAGALVRDAVKTLVELELIASRAHAEEELERLRVPELGWKWDREAVAGSQRTDEDRCWRLARALAWGAVLRAGGSDGRGSVPEASWLRPVLLPHRLGEKGWRLTSGVPVPDLVRGAEPAKRLLELVLRHAVRLGAGVPLPSSPRGADLSDVGWLLAKGGPCPDAVAKLAGAAARFTGPRSGEQATTASHASEAATTSGEGAPKQLSHGEALARVLVAAQPWADELHSPGLSGEALATPHPALARRARLSALARSGDMDALSREATAELWRRELELPLLPARVLTELDRDRLALALMLSLTTPAVDALVATIVPQPDSSTEGT